MVKETLTKFNKQISRIWISVGIMCKVETVDKTRILYAMECHLQPLKK